MRARCPTCGSAYHGSCSPPRAVVALSPLEKESVALRRPLEEVVSLYDELTVCFTLTDEYKQLSADGKKLVSDLVRCCAALEPRLIELVAMQARRAALKTVERAVAKRADEDEDEDCPECLWNYPPEHAPDCSRAVAPPRPLDEAVSLYDDLRAVTDGMCVHEAELERWRDKLADLDARRAALEPRLAKRRDNQAKALSAADAEIEYFVETGTLPGGPEKRDTHPDAVAKRRENQAKLRCSCPYGLWATDCPEHGDFAKRRENQAKPRPDKETKP